MEDDEKQIRHELSGQCLGIAKGSLFVPTLIFDNIDSFVALSRDNTIVREVELYPFDSDAGNYEFWDKVGQIVGNLMELKTLRIYLQPHIEDGDEIPVLSGRY
jgi:hypothetical protein